MNGLKPSTSDCVPSDDGLQVSLGRNVCFVSGGGFAPLGNNTKCFSSKTEKTPVSAPMVAGKLPLKVPPKTSLREKRFLRYLLQSVSRSLHLKSMPNNDDPIGTLNKAHRVCKCSRVRVKPEVSIFKSLEYNKAFYGGLSICGSVWDCPVCSAKIQERRRSEVAHMMDWAYRKGFTVTMVTFTFPHYGWQSCKDLLDKQKLAFAKLRSGSVWSNRKSEVGYVGLVRGLEVNHGKNGWHPHTHELWIHKPLNHQSRLKFEKVVKDRWLACCKKFDLVPYGKVDAFRKYAVDFKFNAKDSDYLNKLDDSSSWGVDREIVKSSSKETLKGRPPFALLVDSAKGCLSSGKLFIEYSKAFKGKSQLFWSQGLKELCNLEDFSDKELAELKEDDAELLMKLEMFAWADVVSNEAIAHVLELAEMGGYDAVHKWLKTYGSHDVGIDTY